MKIGGYKFHVFCSIKVSKHKNRSYTGNTRVFGHTRMLGVR